MALTLDQLRRARDCPGNLPPDVEAEILACSRQWIENADKGATLDASFGVTVAPGGRPWFAILAEERRDHALREIGWMACPGGCVSQRADAVVSELRRYAERWRRRDQYLTEAPAPATPLAILLFEANRTGPPPDSVRRIRKILSD